MNKGQEIKPKYTWIIDPGHGGIFNGEYATTGKRYTFPDGLTIYEGQFNRVIAAGIVQELARQGFDYVLFPNSNVDVSLAERVDQANTIHKAKGNVVYLSVHANAGGGTGFEIYTSRGNTASDGIAKVFFEKAQELLGDQFRMRHDYSDNDPDKEANFYVLRHTICPALLTENLFMDTRKDAEFMFSAEGQKAIIQYHIEAIKEIEGQQ